ncbi:MAG: archaeosortase H [Candidatus Hermodarchaeota archaeon]
MKLNLANKYVVWVELSIILILGFIFSIFTAVLVSDLGGIIFFVMILVLFLIQAFLILKFVIGRLDNKKKFGIILYHSLNLLFTVIIGFSIPLMESDFKNNTGIVMIPMLLILGLIITDKYDKTIKNVRYEQEPIKDEAESKPIIEFEDKKYVFSLNSLLILAVGTPLLAYGIYLFFDTEAQFWLHEIVVKQTVYFLNLFFNMDVSVSYSPVGKYHWSFDFLGGNINGDPLGSIFFETFCTGIQAICVFAGIIICTPHSRDKNTNKDIIWRKTKALIVSSVIFYVVNIIRMLIQIELYYIGYPWDSIHVSISAASSFIAAIIILLLHKWIPEFIISIIYIGTLISKKFKQLRNPKEN